MLRPDRRTLLGGALALGATITIPYRLLAATTAMPALPPGKPPAIIQAEREQRIEQVRRLMRAAGISALLVEPGSSLIYSTGIAASG